jgi:hypothetical protein
MIRGFKNISFILLLLLFYTCKTPYTPAPITAVNNYLVVEGLININDSTFISLSRTVGVMSASTVKPELKATLSIVSNTGSSYPLKEVGNGVYSAPSYNLSAANQYRLMIKTSNGSTYASDFEQTKVTPPIDSLITDEEPDGIHFSVNTHDPQNATRYYRWDYSEAWQFTSYFNSTATAQGALPSPLYPGFLVSVVPRTNDIYHCWGGDASATILLNTTAGLSQDIIQNQPITFVASSSEKLSIRYSINIREYTLTQDAYTFWTLLKTNTEQLGSIFDAQPSATIGNIHNINNLGEVVIGYMSACSVSQKRIYLNYTDLPKSYVADYLNNTPYNKYTCALDTVIVDPVAFPPAGSEFDLFINGYPHALQIPVAIIIPFNPLAGTGSASGSSPGCVDCTLRGTNVKPAFWQ